MGIQPLPVYHPDAGVYNVQDPLGATPRIASAQGYVNHPAHWVHILGLMAHGLSRDNIPNSVTRMPNGQYPRNAQHAGKTFDVVGNGPRAVQASAEGFTEANFRSDGSIDLDPHIYHPDGVTSGEQ
ncbi:hypothetical protein [Corynebacterium cystitidis]|uniref:hypothetical protein n=1 Tax=Corynebacterium cystitidis TaxID=35757 RepID=UPI000B8845B4|nr:hypothetical protein [Corynebacterium cystitidis]